MRQRLIDWFAFPSIVMVALIVIACVPGEQVAGDGWNGAVSRVEDEKYPVVCWLFKVGSGSAISCLEVDKE
jgi:hypothetical protein